MANARMAMANANLRTYLIHDPRLCIVIGLRLAIVSQTPSGSCMEERGLCFSDDLWCSLLDRSTLGKGSLDVDYDAIGGCRWSSIQRFQLKFAVHLHQAGTKVGMCKGALAIIP